MCIVVFIGESQLFLKSLKASPRNGEYQEKIKGCERSACPIKQESPLTLKPNSPF